MNWRNKIRKVRGCIEAEIVATDPPYDYSNTTDSSPWSHPLSLEELEAAEKEFKKFLDGSVELPSPDILIMTEEHWKLLREQTYTGVTPLRPDSPPDLLGIPVEIYPTYKECRARAFLLLDEGKRVGLVEDNPNE